MYTPTSVSLSGPAFSYLLYENTKCRFQQEGLLLGEIVRKETKTITDNDQQQVNINRTIKINSVIPFPQNHYFYSGTGKIDKDKIKAFLGNQFSSVVAWYKYQRTPTAKVTLRDKIIHRQFLELFNINPELFSCCVLTNEISENGSTHLFSQIFVRCNSISCDQLPLNIPNLSEPNNMYKNSESASDTFNQILGDLKIDKKNTQGLVIINKIHNALQKHIETLVKDLSESEKDLYELEEEVNQLEILKKLKEKNADSLESASESTNNTQTSSPSISNNTKGENNKVPGCIDTTSSESSPDVQRKTVHKRSASRGRGRGKKDSKELKKDSKIGEKEVLAYV